MRRLAWMSILCSTIVQLVACVGDLEGLYSLSAPAPEPEPPVDPMFERAWIQVDTSGRPSPGRRMGVVSAYDDENDRAILFGGCRYQAGGSCTAVEDVWILVDATSDRPHWEQLQTAGSAPFNIWSAAAFDQANNRLIVFAAGQVWLLENANGLSGRGIWSQLAASGDLPPNLIHAALAFNASDGSAVLFGGENLDLQQQPSVADLWILEHANGLGGAPVWSRIAGNDSTPPGRGGAALAYDPIAGRIVLFGGGSWEPQAFHDDVWAWTPAGARWLQRRAANEGEKPRGRREHVMLYDAERERAIVFGGCARARSAGCSASNDLWVLEESLHTSAYWRRIEIEGPLPARRYGHGAAYNPANDTLVVFNGEDTELGVDDVWILRNATR